MRGIIPGLFYLLTCFYSYGINAQSELLRKEIDKIIRYEQSIDFAVVPGIIVGIIDGDSTFTYTFGRDINLQGIYEMGSVTKPVVAWLANEALETLHLNRLVCVCAFLPDTLCIPWTDLSFDQLIEHKTGLPRLPPGIGEVESNVTDPYSDYTIELLARDLKRQQPSPGDYSYSHLGYAMTHWLFEKAGGLHQFTRENLTGPYGMNDTQWELSDTAIEQGHGLDGRPQPPWNTNALRTALGLKSSLHDMMIFMRILFDGYENNRRTRDPSLLKKELKSLSKTGAYKVVDGWFVINAGKSLVYYHNGRTGGHHVSIAFTPHLRKGVIVIANGSMGSNDLSLLILRMINKAKRTSDVR